MLQDALVKVAAHCIPQCHVPQLDDHAAKTGRVVDQTCHLHEIFVPLGEDITPRRDAVRRRQRQVVCSLFFSTFGFGFSFGFAWVTSDFTGSILSLDLKQLSNQGIHGFLVGAQLLQQANLVMPGANGVPQSGLLVFSQQQGQ